ncbi:DNA-binding regulatory protein, YebC/PmpR family [Abditibacterium utsteinense]|uniref:Probable transcriptional regulatory protein B1R32_10563 n=1 Tax=Abditibacterium utsteinense TaxID=1960156 RepID=A0A2S8SUA1_9BACT|nr:YebC/PmpR family DNA-binding transcriptional regulator [Abditibacterium utsteinense]PQV64382.1 DNA-binding regulatory protein, YebC/PmpR family [Abditibacterium utsteinense]
MAGHSKWKNIRLHKGKADVVRAKLFGKLSRDLTTAAKAGGEPDSNPRLRLAIDKAKAGSMPADNIKRAIQKGTGELAADNFDEVTYEGYGPNGVAVMVETATDNRNRTVADIRSIFNKNGGSLGESGSVAWQFERKGQITVAALNVDEDALFEAALEAGAEDVQREGDEFLVQAAPETLSALQIALEGAGFTIADLEVSLVPTTTIELEGDSAKKMLKLLDALEDYADVQSVSANFELSDAELGES